jgi:hypothetical protein
VEYLEPYVVDQLSEVVLVWVVDSAATGFVGHVYALEHVEELAESGFAEELFVVDLAEMPFVVGHFASNLVYQGPILP